MKAIRIVQVFGPVRSLTAKFSTSIPRKSDADLDQNLGRNSLDFDDEFKGLTGVSKCVANEISGPEPNYQSLNPNSYKLFKQNDKFYFRNGGILPETQIAYETWGKLNETKSNAILLFTGLSANSHAKSNKVT